MTFPTDYRTFEAPAPDLDDKSILVTGGTGSFGQHFTATVLERFSPRRLIIFSRDELKQYDMAHEPCFADCGELRFFIGDVRDRDRLEMAMRDVDYVVHAAALKQVLAAEYNPFECVHTNVLGAENVVQAALRAGVKRVIALSTDKAASPINLYGASKLAAEKILVAANNLAGGLETKFSAVRYGNVIGTRGSVVPLYRRLIAEGADSLPITDPRMTRFWLTLTQGVNFVLSSLAMMCGGEIFVPKVASMKVVDLAEAMAAELPHRIVGIRPGEKIHETLITENDARNTIEMKDRFIIEPAFAFWSREPYVGKGGNPTLEGFRYTSDGNKEWYDAEDLRRLLETSGDG